ncbi:MAG TPA: EpsI family protein [Bryobacteraceae bacterium]|nr:EpsI family protein [Bryobacteraceae bacterium]
MLTAILLLQVALVYGFTRNEVIPVNKPLSEVPTQFGGWAMQQEGVVEKEVQDVLKADELLTRSYTNPELRIGAHMFVAYFRSQRTGQAPHSPKNCLPGSGWVPSLSDIVPVQIPGRAEPIEVNRYVVAKGDQKSLVLYWYQSRDRVVASEYRAKFFVMADALRYNRTDTALVRVVMPIADNDVERSHKAAVDFIQAFYMPLRQHFPA